MKYVSFSEYQAAKNEILYGNKYVEDSALYDNGVCNKQYATENNGTFYQVNDNGIVEFWSDKYPDSRYLDNRTQEEKQRAEARKAQVSGVSLEVEIIKPNKLQLTESEIRIIRSALCAKSLKTLAHAHEVQKECEEKGLPDTTSYIHYDERDAIRAIIAKIDTISAIEAV